MGCVHFHTSFLWLLLAYVCVGMIAICFTQIYIKKVFLQAPDCIVVICPHTHTHTLVVWVAEREEEGWVLGGFEWQCIFQRPIVFCVMQSWTCLFPGTSPGKPEAAEEVESQTNKVPLCSAIQWVSFHWTRDALCLCCSSPYRPVILQQRPWPWAGTCHSQL